MKLISSKDYIDKLSELFPEVDINSIKEIMRVGNKSIISELKASKTSTVILKGKGNHVLDDMHGDIMLFEFHTVKYNNSAKYIKRKKDLNNGSK